MSDPAGEGGVAAVTPPDSDNTDQKDHTQDSAALTTCPCGESDCDLYGLSYDDLLHRAHKHRGSLRMGLGSLRRRADFIRERGLWDEFTASVRRA